MQSQVKLCQLRKTKKAGCYERVMDKKRGLVNYTTLEGLSFYKEGVATQSKHVKECERRLETHVQITTIPEHLRELCSLLPR